MELVSDDDRRKLYELGNGGDWKVCKILIAKEDCYVGDHYHNDKDEMFALIDGSGIFEFEGVGRAENAPYSVFINRGVWHKFFLSKGSVLICLATSEHDPNDDHKL